MANSVTSLPLRRTTPPSRARSAGGPVGTVILLALAALLGSTLVVWNRSAETRAIGRLPDAERHALYERTLRTLREPCAAQRQGGGLNTFCRDQAEFVLRFAECAAECQSLARTYVANPIK